MAKSTITAGDQFGRLTVVERLPNGSNGETRWLCQCECGNRHEAAGYLLKRGAVRSCGCIKPGPKARSKKPVVEQAAQHLFMLDGDDVTLAEAATRVGLSEQFIMDRIALGMPPRGIVVHRA